MFVFIFTIIGLVIWMICKDKSISNDKELFMRNIQDTNQNKSTINTRLCDEKNGLNQSGLFNLSDSADLEKPKTKYIVQIYIKGTKYCSDYWSNLDKNVCYETHNDAYNAIRRFRRLDRKANKQHVQYKVGKIAV